MITRSKETVRVWGGPQVPLVIRVEIAGLKQVKDILCWLTDRRVVQNASEVTWE